MTQLERMKEYVITQIENMPPKDFMRFSEALGGNYEIENVIETKGLFTCKDCKDKFGTCLIEKNGTKECYDKYAKYCSEEI